MAALNFKKYVGEGYDVKGRAHVKIGGGMQHHVVYTRTGLPVPIDDVREAMRADLVERDRMQGRTHLKGIK